MYREWRQSFPELAAELDAGMDACARGVDPSVSDKDIPAFSPDDSDATVPPLRGHQRHRKADPGS
ncbi:MAG: hypothetical protein ACLSUW_11135 [Akkermansia sp.]